MAKVSLDYGPISNNCITSIDSVIDALNEAIKYLQQNSSSSPKQYSKTFLVPTYM